MTHSRLCVKRMWLTPYFLLKRGCPLCSPALVLYRWMLSSSLAVTSRFSVRWKSSELMVASESYAARAVHQNTTLRMISTSVSNRTHTGGRLAMSSHFVTEAQVSRAEARQRRRIATAGSAMVVLRGQLP